MSGSNFSLQFAALGEFTSVGQSGWIQVLNGAYDVAVWGDFVGTVNVLFNEWGGTQAPYPPPLVTFTEMGDFSGSLASSGFINFVCAAYTSGTIYFGARVNGAALSPGA